MRTRAAASRLSVMSRRGSDRATSSSRVGRVEGSRCGSRRITWLPPLRTMTTPCVRIRVGPRPARARAASQRAAGPRRRPAQPHAGRRRSDDGIVRLVGPRFIRVIGDERRGARRLATRRMKGHIPLAIFGQLVFLRREPSRRRHRPRAARPAFAAAVRTSSLASRASCSQAAVAAGSSRRNSASAAAARMYAQSAVAPRRITGGAAGVPSSAAACTYEPRRADGVARRDQGGLDLQPASRRDDRRAGGPPQASSAARRSRATRCRTSSRTCPARTRSDPTRRRTPFP